MSEDDRATKAARAKAMLKKRQQKKVAESGGPASDVPSIPSRTSTPAPSESLSVGDTKRDNIDDVFSLKGALDTSWVSTLPRAPSPPARIASPLSSSRSQLLPSSSPKILPVGPSAKELELQKEVARLRLDVASFQEQVQRISAVEEGLKVAQDKGKNLESLLEQERSQYSMLESRLELLRQESGTQIKNHEDTISLLVSEKAALTTELHRLDEIEARAHTAEESFDKAKAENIDLNSQLERLRNHISSMTSSLEELKRKEKDVKEKHREQERQLQLVTALGTEARKDADRYQRSLKELQEQIQNDDRLERVETSLKHTQERADELEFQLSKLKHAHSILKTENDNLDSQLSEFAATKNKLETLGDETEKNYESTLEELTSVTEHRDLLVLKKAALEQSIQTQGVTITGLHAQLAAAGTEIGNQKRQIQTLQSDLKTTQKRYDDSERTQKRLQSEGTNLMRSLDELRPKVVELTEDKVELSEKLAQLEHALRDRDNVISNLETSLGEAKLEKESLQTEWASELSRAEHERSQAATSSSEMEKGFSELQRELGNALDSIRALGSERQSLRQETQNRLQEVEQLSNNLRSQSAEITQLQYELNERRAAQEEEEEFLEQAQNEIESLRSEVDAKTAELEQLRRIQLPSQNGSPPSLNEEMLNSLRQQHALDLSAFQTQIRALENSVFDAEARTHGLQKQVHALEAQLTQARASPRLGQQRSFSPNHFSRPSSRVQSHSELGRTSFSSSQKPSALSRSVFDQGLSPETRHKRKVSLSMLKARIESEVANGPLSRALSPVDSQSGEDSESPQPEFAQHRRRHDQQHQHQHQHQKGSHYRPQFMDESHVFWCSSCTGELVVL